MNEDMKTSDGFPLRGPHEGREFELLEKGRKHVAYFYDWIPEEYEAFKTRPEYGVIEWQEVAELPEDALARLRERGAQYEGLHDGSGVIHIPYRILYRKDYEAQARRLEEITRIYGQGLKPELEREIGAILGYPEEAVEYFIANFGAQY